MSSLSQKLHSGEWTHRRKVHGPVGRCWWWLHAAPFLSQWRRRIIEIVQVSEQHNKISKLFTLFSFFFCWLGFCALILLLSHQVNFLGLKRVCCFPNILVLDVCIGLPLTYSAPRLKWTSLIFQPANEILPIQQTNTEEWGRRGKKKHTKK